MRAVTDGLVGLVSMPWMAIGMPSIQLATLAAALRRESFASESHELFLDYATRIGLSLYATLSDAGGTIEEWLFARHYFAAEFANALSEFREHRPRFGLASREVEEQTIDALGPVTEQFLHDMVEEIDWSRYDVIGFTLTISQTAASMALARLIKQKYPRITIVCGGSACAGPMGPALLRVCPYIDVVVTVEGEPVFAELVRRIRLGASLDDLTGVCWRSGGQVVINPKGPLYRPTGDRPHLNYDAYFERLQRLGIHGKFDVWLPFESSRGCWYGEKNQCTFCGLHDIMEYRYWSWESVLAELEDWAQRYGARRFFSVDLIMPRSYLQTLLPEVARRGHDWFIFYEIKANARRAEVETLAAAGVRWIQPGIESLDADVLRLMHKGVSPLQNVQLLKWCAELDIRVTWNVIVGIPGENPDCYARMAERMHDLVHLTPPSGASPFQLHRFSPFFEEPTKYGIRRLGASSLYKYIFPIPAEDLDHLVYRYDYELVEPPASSEYVQAVRDAIRDWKAAHKRGAALRCYTLTDGSVKIEDTRHLPATTHELEPSQAVLYLFLDAATPENTLADEFAKQHPAAAAELQQRDGIASLIEAWQQRGLVLRDGGRVLAIAVNANRAERDSVHHSADLHLPVAYLDDRVEHAPSMAAS